MLRVICSSLVFLVAVQAAFSAGPAVPNAPHPLAFIDTSFENASAVWYEFAPDGTVRVHLLYDHERSSPNRAAGHIHFRLQAAPGSKLTLEFKNLDNVWNGKSGSVARELKTLVVSEDGQSWRSVPTESLPDNRVLLHVEMPGPKLYVARVEPYRLSDLERLLDDVRGHALVQISAMGRTVQGRALEIVRVGRENAPFRVFVRARAHPWESGGNWVVEGLVRRLLKDDASTREFLDRYCVYILPLANKDGVALGRTRFNLLGKDLNRDWDEPADPKLAPENHALEQWLEGMIRAGRKPHLALELHNDGGGRLHLSRPPVPELAEYLDRMKALETLLRRHTWFTEGPTQPSFRNSGTLGDGWLERYGIDAVVHEFHCNWIAGLEDYPSAKHWQDYGANLATVFHEYFGLAQNNAFHDFIQAVADGDDQDVSPSPPRDNRSLKEAVGDRFKLGVGVSHSVVRNPEDADLIRRHFEILTPENCMKPQGIHPEEDQWNFEAADRFADFARSNKFEMVGHCLVWAKDDRTDEWMKRDNGGPVSRETLLQRIESHIHTVVGRYADVATMWDVVNEAIGDSGDGLLRDSVYSRATGMDFIVTAFEAARAQDPDALLIYNDYNGHKPGKREKLIELLTELKRRGAPVDAYGMQGHFELGDDSIPQLRETFDALRELGLKVVVSELDIDVVTRGRWWAEDGKYRDELAAYDPYRDGLPEEIQQRQTEQYVALFGLFAEYSDIIERVSFWNLHDGQSWLNYFPWRRVNHPLLFDRDRRPKPAFNAVYEALRVD